MTDSSMRPATELRIVRGAPETKPERTPHTDIPPTERHGNTAKDRERQTDKRRYTRSQQLVKHVVKHVSS